MRKLIIVSSNDASALDRSCDAFALWFEQFRERLLPRDVVVVATDGLLDLTSMPSGVSLVRYLASGEKVYPDGYMKSWRADGATRPEAIASAVDLWVERGGVAFHVEFDVSGEPRSPRQSSPWTHLDRVAFRRHFSTEDPNRREWPWEFGTNDLLVLDTETSGKVPGRHQLLEVGAIRTDARGHVLAEYTAKIPLDPSRPYEDEALRVNGYRDRVARGDWLDAVPLATALDGMLYMLAHCPALVAHYASFDRSVIDAACAECGIDAPVYRTTFDTCIMARRILQKTGRIRDAKLDTVCDYYGISNTGNHAALIDARRCLAAYRKLSAGDVSVSAIVA